MRRLYFLLPNVATAQSVVDGLKSAGVEERHIHVIAAPGTPLKDLPEAGVTERSYLLPALKKGAEYGGTIGLLFGLSALNLPGVVLAGGALLAMGLVGAGMGACLGCLLGADKENVNVKALESAIREGQLLVMVDVPTERVGDFETLVKQRYPEAELKATESRVPDFPY